MAEPAAREASMHGLVILRASRLEALVPPLHDLLAVTRPDDLLQPQTVVAAHPGMKTWLMGALARHVGPGGVVANLDVVLPSTWLDGLARGQLGEAAVALPGYQRKHLRWTLHDLLDPARPAAGVSDARVARYLGGHAASDAERARRRFQLADRLAGIYTQYLVYRPDWLTAWERGQDRFAAGRAGDADLAMLESGLLAPLWRALQQRLGLHRAQALEQVAAVLRREGAPREPVHLFGLSHLAPFEMALLRAYARGAPVFLYVPDPCREYWGGLARPDDAAGWGAFREEEAARIEAAGAGDYWHGQAHPLLARWGRMGQHFFAGLAEGEVREDQRHWEDERPAPPANRLQRLQEGIRRLDPGLMREAPGEAARCTDASLRVHACHTRLRELEVLRDALLHAIEHEGVRAGDIVVMAPDIAAYAPLVPSVFGEPGSARERLLPYHLADVPVAAGHRLFHTFSRLLDLAASRIATPEVVDLLAIPEVQRRFGLDEEAVDTLAGWLAESRVAWALDAGHRAGFGLPALATHSFAWAMDRMLAGYLMADAPAAEAQAAVELGDGSRLLPLPGVHGPGAEAVGALDRLLQELQAWQALARDPRSASDWVLQLQARLDALFRADPGDPAATAAEAALKRSVAALGTETARAGLDPVLDFAVVRDLLQDALAAVPERQRFLMGGVTFCGMVPQRAIPFAVVCVLGLDDGAFPRQRSDGGLDLMSRLRRIGDRDVRTDDRYLFLETVMSARRRLHLSYLGQGVRDGAPRNPAPPLAELLAELDRAAGIDPAAEDADTRRAWWVKHPLQPFDARYFDGSDARLCTYQARFARMWGEGRARPAPFLSADADAPPPDALPQPLDLAALRRWFKAPAEQLLRDRLGLRRDALDGDTLAEDEPLGTRLAPVHAVARRVFLQQVLPAWPDAAGLDAMLAEPPDWLALSGLLPIGRDGAAAWAAEAASVKALMAAALDCPALQGGAAVDSIGIDLHLPGLDPADAPVHLRGRLGSVLAPAAGQGWRLLHAFPRAGEKSGLKAAADLDFGDQAALFIEWAALRLQTLAQGDARPVQACVLAADAADWPFARGLQAWDAALIAAHAAGDAGPRKRLAQRLRALVHLWQQAQAEPPAYFPRASWKAHVAALAAADPLGGDAAAVARAANSGWVGHDGDSGERDRSPGYTRLLTGELEFGDAVGDPGHATLAALLAYAERLAGLLRPDVEVDALLHADTDTSAEGLP